MTGFAPPDQCDVFIQIWVDVNIASATQGIYIVDNRLSSGSTGEGTYQLTTACERGDDVCWTVLPVDGDPDVQLTISSIGNSNAWGIAGPPQAYGSTGTVYTGKVQNSGNAPYEVALNVNFTSTIPLNLFMQVS
jgi:hypothetical protein